MSEDDIGGSLTPCELDRLVLGIVPMEEAELTTCSIDEGFADRDRLNQGLSMLSARHKRILRLRFGFYGGSYGAGAMTIAEIGAELGISKQRVSTLVRSALEKLRLRMLHAHLVDASDGVRAHYLLSPWEVAMEQRRAFEEHLDRQALWEEACALAKREREADGEKRDREIEEAMEEGCRGNREALAKASRVSRRRTRPTVAPEPAETSAGVKWTGPGRFELFFLWFDRLTPNQTRLAWIVPLLALCSLFGIFSGMPDAISCFVALLLIWLSVELVLSRQYAEA